MQGTWLAAASSAVLAFAPAAQPPGPSGGSGYVVLKAGTVHVVEKNEVLTGGASILVRDGVIVAVGKGVVPPPGAEVIDYGPSAVIVPGLVAASSSYAVGASSQRTADPLVRAVDAFDPYSSALVVDAMAGVTCEYIAPSRMRLIGGQGAVIKPAGEGARRVLGESVSIHGTITAAARNVSGYWEPPIPATVDVGLGVAQPQLPGSPMGAILALDELLALAKGRTPDTGAYGPGTAEALRTLIAANTLWRMGADTPAEIRALLAWARREKLPLVLDGGAQSGELAAEIAAAGVPVIVAIDAPGQAAGRDLGKGDEARWPAFDNAARLVAAGVEIAIAPDGGLHSRDLRFAAQLASRGGLSDAAALRAITLGAAKLLGVDARVGSLTPGKDADFCVLSGAPLSATSGVLATWINGKLAWKSPATAAVVIEADELYIGDGEVLRPGQVLLRDGLIAEVGTRVGHPPGATVVQAPAAMPGMIDALGFLGLEGSQRVPQTDFKLARILDAADDTDRRVARSGVTTVVLAPRGVSDSGTPVMAYKPASEQLDKKVLADPTALRLQWTNANRLLSGQKVKELLDKARDYDKKWRDYEAALAKWVPPAPGAEAAEEKKAEAKGGEGDKPEDKDKAKSEEKKDEAKNGAGDKKDDKKKKDKKDEDEPDPVSGIWTAKVTVPPYSDEVALRLRMQLEGERVTGSLRCDQVSTTLVTLVGVWKDKQLHLAGLGSRGFVNIDGVAKGGKLDAQLALEGSHVKLAAERETKEVPVAGRPELRREKKDEAKEPKGKPRSPGIDEKLEPFRRAMKGTGAIIVSVDRENEILDCVAAFEAAGIKPILHEAGEVLRVMTQIRGRVAGVLLTQQVLDVEEGKGLDALRNRYAELAAAGIPVAFHSLAEEGAAELLLIAEYAVANGLSPDVALRALTSDAAKMLAIQTRVGGLVVGLDGDVLVLDGPPLEPSTSVLRAFVDGREVR